MGLFTKKSPEQKLAEKQDKARAGAEKARVDLTGAVAFGHHLHDLGDGAYAWVTMVVRPDRVEVINHGAVNVPMKHGKGTTVILAGQINAVSDHRDVGVGVVRIEYGGGQVVEFRTSHEEAPVLAEQVRSLTA